MDSQELQRIKNRYDIVGSDPSLSIAIETALAIAPSDLAVLITGESGVGKDVFPRMIHENSRRKNGKYFAVNCGAIPVGTINAELFGHEKGSFTGAIAEHKGYFEEANGGTLFLDEIGELPRETQAMLLRVLQNGEYMKVGSSKVEKTDVRIIAATNVNLEHLVTQGKFREDLYYRLNGIKISLPSLRERKEDIVLLFRKFSSDFAQKTGLCRVGLEFDAIAKLRNYRWPGNIRQLKNFAEVVTMLESKPLSPGVDKVEIGADAISRHLPHEEDTLIPAISGHVAGSAPGALADEDKRKIISAILDLKKELDQLKEVVSKLQGGYVPMPAPEPEDVDEQFCPEPVKADSSPVSLKKAGDELIWRTLEKYNGNVKLAAKELDIAERTIYRKLAARKNK